MWLKTESCKVLIKRYPMLHCLSVYPVHVPYSRRKIRRKFADKLLVTNITGYGILKPNGRKSMTPNSKHYISHAQNEQLFILQRDCNFASASYHVLKTSTVKDPRSLPCTRSICRYPSCVWHCAYRTFIFGEPVTQNTCNWWCFEARRPQSLTKFRQEMPHNRRTNVKSVVLINCAY